MKNGGGRGAGGKEQSPPKQARGAKKATNQKRSEKEQTQGKVSLLQLSLLIGGDRERVKMQEPIA